VGRPSALQQDLARRVVGQVGAAHDVAHALRGVVHHHGQLVGPQPVGAAQHEVADFGLHVLPLRTEPAVLPFEPRCGAQPRCVQAPGPRRAGLAAVAAGAGVDRLLVPGPLQALGLQRRLDLLARRRSRRPGRRRAGAAGLAHRAHGAVIATPGAVGLQAAGGQLLDQQGVGAGRAARRIDVFDAQQPRPPWARASSQLASAATSEPACSGPVGEGAKRPT
jgi:hypothetical protein